MAWRIEFERNAARELERLGPQAAQRILKFLHQRVALRDDPRSVGQALHGPRLGEFWKYRIGEYRVIARIEDGEVRILGVRVGNRREVYR
jgi:mRNA interferase RelE/StbE